VGMAAQRVLPPYARQRFTTWFKWHKPSSRPTTKEAAVFPTCFIEYMEPAIGRDLVGVYERNGISCSVPQGTKCCGAPGSTRATWPSSRSRPGRMSQPWPRRFAPGRMSSWPSRRVRTCSSVTTPLRRGCRRRAGGRAHLRPGRVPAAPPPERGTFARPRLPRARERARHGHVPRALPPPGTEHRPEEPRPAEAGRREV